MSTQEDLPATKAQRDKLYQLSKNSYYLEAEMTMAYAGSEVRRLVSLKKARKVLNAKVS